MSISPRDVINEVLQLPSPLFLQQAVGFMNSFTSAAVNFVQKQLERQKQLHQEGVGSAKRSAPFMPSQFIPNRNEKLTEDHKEDELKHKPKF